MGADLRVGVTRLPARSRGLRPSWIRLWRQRRRRIRQEQLETIERLQREARVARRYRDAMPAVEQLRR
jgi:hypothetical protein